jgi:glycosyltransferase involved in cell wall biosynthesis
MTVHKIKIAIYGDINLNLIDGSSIWVQSVAMVFAGLSKVNVTLLLKAPERRPMLTAPLRELGGLRLVEPYGGALTPDQALDELEALDDETRFDVLVLRGFKLCALAADRPRFAKRLWCYLTDIPHRVDEIDAVQANKIQQIAQACDRILCQTEALRSYLEDLAPAFRQKSFLLPPVVPDQRSGPSPYQTGSIIRMVYAGKFAPQWGTVEMFEAFSKLRSLHPSAELHVFGDKIHNPAELPGFRRRVESTLEGTKGVVWHGTTPREEVGRQLADMSIAWAWRPPDFERETLELSTKILEYGQARLPTVATRSLANEGLLGEDYPLFASDADNAASRLIEAVEDRALSKAAVECLSSRLNKYTYSAARARIVPLIAHLELKAQLGKTLSGRTLLVAGHDLKFLEGLLDLIGGLPDVRLLVDKWSGHDQHDEGTSRRMIAQADFVFCEWCLGNAVWYSRNIRSDQRLIVRLHRQELWTGHLNEIDQSRVKGFVVVGDAIRQHLMASNMDGRKIVVIPNAIRSEIFEREKLNGSRFNVGVIGFVPIRKRLDLALDVLDILATADPRYTLRLKGKMPGDYGWMRTREEEHAFFDAEFRRLHENPVLRNRVVFDGFENDVGEWLRRIGYVLSTSDDESFHLAIAEGAASGAVPCVLPWPGSDRLYPSHWICSDPRAMANRILEIEREGQYLENAEEARNFAGRFNATDVYARLASVIFDEEFEQGTMSNQRQSDTSVIGCWEPRVVEHR